MHFYKNKNTRYSILLTTGSPLAASFCPSRITEVIFEVSNDAF